MSCYMVGEAHISALIEAGLYARTAQHGSNLSWMCRPADPEERADAYERGEVWGPGAIELAASLRRELTRETADRVGQMLLHENRLSVDHRYNECELEDIYRFPYWTSVTRVNPVVILKALACYEYQSCEHPGWEGSEAHAFCEALQHAMIRILPGYDEGPGWEIQKRAEYLAEPPAILLSRLAAKPRQERLL